MRSRGKEGPPVLRTILELIIRLPMTQQIATDLKEIIPKNDIQLEFH